MRRAESRKRLIISWIAIAIFCAAIALAILILTGRNSQPYYLTW